MIRIALAFCLIYCAGCSDESDPKAGDQDPGHDLTADVEEGGVVKNDDRDKAATYFIALGKVQSAEEEGKLLSEFGEWLEKGGYRIRVEEKNGKHVLACPYFPPRDALDGTYVPRRQQSPTASPP